MQIPTFPECDHDVIKALMHLSDYALVEMLQKSPMDGKYFTTLFCRYSPVIYSLIHHSARSPVQADYLFALTWRHILNELGGIDLSLIHQRQHPVRRVSAEAKAEAHVIDHDLATQFSLQGWLINLTAAHINQAVLPDVESIHYCLSDAPPPLWCYTERALESLSSMHRLIVLMAQTFEWSETRISAYLQAEGKQLSPAEVRSQLQIAYRSLERAIPKDIRAIYLDTPVTMSSPVSEAKPVAFAQLDTSSTEQSDGQSEAQPDSQLSAQPDAPDAQVDTSPDGLLTIEFDEFDLLSQSNTP